MKLFQNFIMQIEVGEKKMDSKGTYEFNFAIYKSVARCENLSSHSKKGLDTDYKTENQY